MKIRQTESDNEENIVEKRLEKKERNMRRILQKISQLRRNNLK